MRSGRCCLQAVCLFLAQQSSLVEGDKPEGKAAPEQPAGACCLHVLVQVRADVCLMPKSSNTRH